MTTIMVAASHSGGGNIVVDAVSNILAAMRQKVRDLYPTEIREWTAEQIDSRAYALAIATIERDKQFKTSMQYMLVANAYEKMLYIADGDDNIKDWISRFPDIPSPYSGRMSQVIALGTEIVPWCMRNGVTAGKKGLSITHNFVGDNINGIAISNRARQFVAKFREIINDESISHEFKVEAMTQLWGVVSNPDNSVREIRDALNGKPSEDIEILLADGVPDFSSLTEAELRWVKRLLKRGITLQEVGSPISISSTGNVSLNAEAFVSGANVCPESSVKVYI